MSVLCLLHGVHEIIFPLWVLAPGLLFHLLFSTYRHLGMCGKSLRARGASRRAQAACCWGHLWSFCLLLVDILRSAEERSHPRACRKFSHVFYSSLYRQGFLRVEVGSHHLQRWLVFQLADRGLVRFPLLSVQVCPF